MAVRSRVLQASPYAVPARRCRPPPQGETAVDEFEHLFDYGQVTALPAADRIQELQQRVQRMQGAGVTRTLDSLPALGEVLRLRTGGAYTVDSPSLAMALMAGPSLAGEWCAVVGVARARARGGGRLRGVPGAHHRRAQPGRALAERHRGARGRRLRGAGQAAVPGQRAPGRAPALPAAAEGRGADLLGSLAALATPRCRCSPRPGPGWARATGTCRDGRWRWGSAGVAPRCGGRRCGCPGSTPRSARPAPPSSGPR